MFAETKLLELLKIAFISVVLILAAGLAPVCAQSQPRPSSPPPPPSSQQPDLGDKPDNDVDFGSRETDARTRLILKAERKAYEEHVGRAKEARDIAAELKTRYLTSNVLNAADQKKLERLEKLTRRIRNDVGGSESDADPNDLPNTISQAVNLLADMAKELSDQVEKTPRRVVSTSIIDQANKLLALIQFVRGSRH
ncbi:MAG TPA: hypothetical protein VIF81_11995 [Pyrinomonadaceae bacterium]